MSVLNARSTVAGDLTQKLCYMLVVLALLAYMLWSQSGKASRKSEAEFAAGFAQTASVNVSIGDSVSIEGAAGSQYATVPVAIDATLADGKQQHLVGTYTLRRSMVDGATPEQRQWRIYSATLKID